MEGCQGGAAVLGVLGGVDPGYPGTPAGARRTPVSTAAPGRRGGRSIRPPAVWHPSVVLGVKPEDSVDVETVHDAAGREVDGGRPVSVGLSCERVRVRVPPVERAGERHMSGLRNQPSGEAEGDRDQRPHGLGSSPGDPARHRASRMSGLTLVSGGPARTSAGPRASESSGPGPPTGEPSEGASRRDG